MDLLEVQFSPVLEAPMFNRNGPIRKRGQGLVEYALILVLIGMMVIIILTFLGITVNNTFSQIGSGLKP